MPRRPSTPGRDWPKLLEEQARSGQPFRAWCFANQIPLNSAYAWRRKLAAAAAALPTSVAAPSSSFVPVRIVAPTVAAPALAALRVRLAGGRSVEIEGEFDAELLRRVVAVLESMPCS